MGMTFTNPISTVTTGSTLSSTQYNQVVTTLNNNTLPPMSIWSLSAAQNPYTSGTTIAYTSATLNTDAMTSASGVITVQTAGVYQILANASVAWTTGGMSAPTLNLYAGGAAIGSNYTNLTFPVGNANIQVMGYASLSASQTVYAQLYFGTATGVQVSAVALTSLAIMWVGI
jgi:hypothetical protein